MTNDLETTTDDLYNTIRALFEQAQGSTGDDLPSSGFGQKVASVPDTDVASESGLDLAAVREYLDNANGVQLVVERDGDTRVVKGVL